MIKYKHFEVDLNQLHINIDYYRIDDIHTDELVLANFLELLSDLRMCISNSYGFEF
jgi:hypothetical protein